MEEPDKLKAMVTLTVRHVPAEVHLALRLRATAHGHSMAAEIREILATSVNPMPQLRMGDALAAIGQHAGLTDENFAVFERRKKAAKPLRLLDFSGRPSCNPSSDGRLSTMPIRALQLAERTLSSTL